MADKQTSTDGVHSQNATSNQNITPVVYDLTTIEHNLNNKNTTKSAVENTVNTIQMYTSDNVNEDPDEEDFQHLLSLLDNKTLTIEQIEKYTLQKMTEILLRKLDNTKYKLEIEFLQEREKCWRGKYNIIFDQFQVLNNVMKKFTDHIQYVKHGIPKKATGSVGLQSDIYEEDGILATDIKVPACLPGNSIITISDDDDDDEVQLLSIQDSNVSRETKRVCFPKDNISPIIRTDDNDDDDDDDYDIAIIEGSSQQRTVLNTNTKNEIQRPFLISGVTCVNSTVKPSTDSYTTQHVAVSHISGSSQPISTASLPVLLSQASAGTSFTTGQLTVSVSKMPSHTSIDHSLMVSQLLESFQPPPSTMRRLISPRIPPASIIDPVKRSVCSWDRVPPAPLMDPIKVLHKSEIVLSWTMPILSYEQLAKIKKYHIYYAYQKNLFVHMVEPWEEIGVVNALGLPMKCSLIHYVTGKKYHFSIRAEDANSSVGLFSEPESLIFV